jgi:hypothetical protein
MALKNDLISIHRATLDSSLDSYLEALLVQRPQIGDGNSQKTRVMSEGPNPIHVPCRPLIELSALVQIFQNEKTDKQKKLKTYEPKLMELNRGSSYGSQYQSDIKVTFFKISVIIYKVLSHL